MIDRRKWQEQSKKNVQTKSYEPEKSEEKDVENLVCHIERKTTKDNQINSTQFKQRLDTHRERQFCQMYSYSFDILSNFQRKFSQRSSTRLWDRQYIAKTQKPFKINCMLIMVKKFAYFSKGRGLKIANLNSIWSLKDPKNNRCCLESRMW